MDTQGKYMKRALELAKRGWGRTNPNPLVGAVIVKNGQIIAEGYHEALGSAHAEAAALSNAKQDVRGGTMYVNLEPCSHLGRTPPCAAAIIEAGIKEVVIAMTDPNPVVSGRGIQMLKDSGIGVKTGVLEEEAKRLNEIFIKYITEKKPFVIMKTAMTIDGKIASVSGDSRWISGESSRQYVHVMRSRVSAVMAGINTVLADNPLLTARPAVGGGRDPVRIVVDRKGILPEGCNVINADSQAGVILATTSAIQSKKEELLAQRGVRVIKVQDRDGYVHMGKLMEELYRLDIDSILLEGGGGLNASALDYGMVDKVMLFIAPKIIGGRNAVTPVEGTGIHFMKDAIGLKNINVSRFDQDILVEGYIANGTDDRLNKVTVPEG